MKFENKEFYDFMFLEMGRSSGNITVWHSPLEDSRLLCDTQNPPFKYNLVVTLYSNERNRGIQKLLKYFYGEE